jgi:hypothetical protein
VKSTNYEATLCINFSSSCYFFIFRHKYSQYFVLNQPQSVISSAQQNKFHAYESRGQFIMFKCVLADLFTFYIGDAKTKRF